MGALLLSLAGCRKEEEKPVDPSSPASYVHDKEFMGSLATARAEQGRLIQSRNEIARQMMAMIEAKKAEMKTDDLKAVRTELEKDAAWRELHAACTNANARVESQRRELLGKVRERLTPKGEKSNGRAASPFAAGTGVGGQGTDRPTGVSK